MSINRYALVHRNNPIIDKVDVLSPLSVGNGEFVYTVDITGMQTFDENYKKGIPLCTLSNWGWHTSPKPEDKKDLDIKPEMFDTYGRNVGYFSSSLGQELLFNWIRENPHRFHLGKIGFCLLKSNGNEVQIEGIENISQTLDLWSGVILSNFTIEGIPVRVKTCCHPAKDLIAISVESPLINQRRLKITLCFPYGSQDITGANWNANQKHHSKVIKNTKDSISWSRIMDKSSYFVSMDFSTEVEIEAKDTHAYVISIVKETNHFEFVTEFSSVINRELIPSYRTTAVQCTKYWANFWMGGGAVDLSQSTDERAVEIERRTVLSQYLTAIQCSGSIPPQETGLTCNSWFGKAHLEMHWWHAVHFSLWGRTEMLEKSMQWYKAVMHKAIENAKRQGYRGARWMKMVDPNGNDSPSSIATLLIWQQPHPIYYAELCYRKHPNKETLELYKDIVFNTAEFMVSFTTYDYVNDRFVLGPPLIPAQENHKPMDTINPTYELEYWHEGLLMAKLWRRRLGMEINKEWDQVISKLSPLPVKDGVYLTHENCPNTFSDFNTDHPSMLNAYGVLHGDLVDRNIMKNTLNKVMKEWNMESTWGWDYPVMAMTAARLGEPEIAIECLLMDTPKNGYQKNGHNYQREDLPLYLPGNGGLLTSIAMMAVGWVGGPVTHAPGFPTDGTWIVQSEGLSKLL